MAALDTTILQEITRRLVAEFKPEKIFLFGSRAWGTSRDDSDIDLLVVIAESMERPASLAYRAHRCLEGIDFSKDVLVKSRSDVEKYKDVRASLIHRILKEGKALYG